MASAQVCRFQRRISNLQTHHELAVKRHETSRKTYLALSHDVMNSLITQLAGSDKKSKKTKRTTKPRLTHFHATKASRFSDPPSYYPSYNGLPQMGSQCKRLGLGDPLPPVTLDHRPSSFEDFDYSRDDHVSSGSCLDNEPIFPPPTYAEQAHSPITVAQQAPSHDSHLIGKCSVSTPVYNAVPLSWSECSAFYYPPSHGAHPSANCNNDPVLSDQSSNSYAPRFSFDPFVSPSGSHNSLPMGVPSCSWARHSSTELKQETPFRLCDQHSEYSYPSNYGALGHCEHDVNSIYDEHTCDRTIRHPGDVSVFPRFSRPAYSEVNPILAFTYPTISGYRANSCFKSCTTLLPCVHSNFSSQDSSDLLHTNPLLASNRQSDTLSHTIEFSYT